MMRRIFYLICLILTSCTSAQPAALLSTPTSTPTPKPLSSLQPVIDAGVAFLIAQHDDELGLLEESPNIGAHRYFVTNDNALAAYVFEQTGQADLAVKIRTAMADFGPASNGFIEAAWGEVIPWPPKHFEDPGSLVATIGEDQIFDIRHEDRATYDWSAYANLACMAR
ncbi:MAG: hypothetical protein R2856_28095 [Caldilineaceae bacterium]